MTFKLTTNGWYVNADNDRCEVALLNGTWVGVYKSGEVCVFNPDGQCHQANEFSDPDITERYNITAAFEGWDSNPFEGAPPGYRFATFEGFYEEEPKAFEEAECFGGGFLGFSQDGIIKHELSDQFIAPFKDPWGCWAKNSLVSRADFEREKQ